MRGPVKIEGGGEHDELEMVEEDFEQDLSVAFFLSHGLKSKVNEENDKNENNEEDEHNENNVLFLRRTPRTSEEAAFGEADRARSAQYSFVTFFAVTIGGVVLLC